MNKLDECTGCICLMETRNLQDDLAVKKKGFCERYLDLCVKKKISNDVYLIALKHERGV